MELEKIVKQRLSEERYYHSVCTMKQCEKLAKIYGVNIEEAKKAGLVHDIAKEMSNEEKLEYVRRNNIELDEVEKKYNRLLHAKIGADIAKREFGFSDEICDAIKYHTTGKEDMNMLTKILFVADYIGEDREFDDTELARSIAYENIDKATIYLLDSIIKERIEEKKMIKIETILARNFLIN